MALTYRRGTEHPVRGRFDTLAACYHALANTEEATRVQELAISRLPADDARIPAYTETLERYRRR